MEKKSHKEFIRDIPDEWELTVAGLTHRYKSDFEKNLDKIFKGIRPKIQRIICVGPNGPINIDPRLINDEKRGYIQKLGGDQGE